ncbi:MAG: carboxy-terminal processing protease [Bdellovibrionaceae bacterium]|nr:carboxy-terminal processing protease [Pseudobdellovibrionaceae bacterium]
MRILIAIAIFGSGLWGGIQWVRHQTFVNPYARLCELIEQKIYLEAKDTVEWNQVCRARAALVTPSTSRETILRDSRFLMGRLGVSHLEIYHPNEVARLWRGVNVETGIESEFVDGELVIFQVHENSPASRAGLQAGDLILSIQDTSPAPALARTIGGLMRIARGAEKFEVLVEPMEIKIDERPSYVEIDPKTVLIKVPSFRAEFFNETRWNQFIAKVPRTASMIVDLRGNGGGNFVAGLRFLAPFMCGEQEIGFLIKPRAKLSREAVLPNDLRNQEQLTVLDAHDLIRLKTEAAPRCLTARVTVLIDGQTASTAEMVAQALRDYLDARVLGVSSAGQLLVGVWYDFPELGEGWRVSVPEAVYQTRRGKRLEGAGVRVDRNLYYELKEMVVGQDSWILRALTDFRREPAMQDSRRSVSK